MLFYSNNEATKILNLFSDYISLTKINKFVFNYITSDVFSLIWIFNNELKVLKIDIENYVFVVEIPYCTNNKFICF